MFLFRLRHDKFSVARHLVRTDLYTKDYKDWDTEERKVANKVCASYDQAGMLIAAGILNKATKEIFLSNYPNTGIVKKGGILEVFGVA